LRRKGVEETRRSERFRLPRACSNPDASIDDPMAKA
jgi:hypothetical protein